MLLTPPCDVLTTFKWLVEISGWSQVTRQLVGAKTSSTWSQVTTLDELIEIVQ